jgi:transcriptional regulator GlxA family with amidase domain
MRRAGQKARKCVGILVFPNVEVLDFCGPYEVFSVTRLDEEGRRDESSPFGILLVSETADPVVATRGLRVIPDATLETCPTLDILVVPGDGERAARSATSVC